MMPDSGLYLLWYFVPYLAVVGLAIGFVMLWAAWRARGRADATAATLVPTSLLMVEQLARAGQRRGGVLAAVGIAGVPAMVILQMGPHAPPWGLGAIVWTIIACIGLRGFFVARGVLAIIEQTDQAVTAQLAGRMLILRRADEEIQLEMSAAAIARVRRHAVPRSIARPAMPRALARQA